MRAIILFLCLILFGFMIGCGGGNQKNKIEASGNIEATNVTVSAKVSGQVTKLFFNEGEMVKTGDTLMTIDHDLLSIQLQQAEAGASAAKAQLSLLIQGARKEDIKRAQDAVIQAKANYDLASTSMERNNRLFKSKSISQQQYDDVSAKYAIAKAQLNSARENLKKLQNFARPEEIQQARANYKRQVAAVNIIKKNISDSYVTAPIGGYIVKKFVEAGESVAPLSSLVMLSNLSYVDLVIYVSETDLGKVKLGQKAVVSVDSYKNKTYEGKVIYISPTAEFTPKNIQTKDERTKLVYAVKIHIHNPDFDLKDGMPADAVINL